MFKNFEVKKSSAAVLKFYEKGDLRNNNLLFVCKSTKSTPNADIVKKNEINGGADTEIFVNYNQEKDESLIKVFITPADTNDLTIYRFFYALKDETVNRELYEGIFYLLPSLLSSGVTVLGQIRHYIGTNLEMQALALTLSSSDEGFVFFYNTDHDSLYVWKGDGWI